MCCSRIVCIFVHSNTSLHVDCMSIHSLLSAKIALLSRYCAWPRVYHMQYNEIMQANRRFVGLYALGIPAGFGDNRKQEPAVASAVRADQDMPDSFVEMLDSTCHQ